MKSYLRISLQLTGMYCLAEWDIVWQMVRHHNIVSHVARYRANGWWLPCPPYDSPHRWQLYHFHTLVYWDRVSYDWLLKYHAQRHRLKRIDNETILCWWHWVCKLDKLCEKIKLNANKNLRWENIFLNKKKNNKIKMYAWYGTMKSNV